MPRINKDRAKVGAWGWVIEGVPQRAIKLRSGWFLLGQADAVRVPDDTPIFTPATVEVTHSWRPIGMAKAKAKPRRKHRCISEAPGTSDVFLETRHECTGDIETSRVSREISESTGKVAQ